ncbi:MAG: DNA alkylation repair protein [Ignavibacteria bacterium]|nr:DNA alkylation repair protein [Ignavibacteria bacterium]
MSEKKISSSDVISYLRKFRNKEKANFLSKYFKTGKSEYGEGDVFWGIYSAEIKHTVRKFRDLPLGEIEKLIRHKVHEVRLAGVSMIVRLFEGSDEKKRQKILETYLRNTKFINNWDLVDISAHKIIGEFFVDKERDLIYRLADSGFLWEERIAVISCFAFIKRNDFGDIFRLSEKFLSHKHDLIHKACGWMLRECGKKDMKKLEMFLMKNHRKMPRTMLRYAVEKFPENKRKLYIGRNTSAQPDSPGK